MFGYQYVLKHLISDSDNQILWVVLVNGLWPNEVEKLGICLELHLLLHCLVTLGLRGGNLEEWLHLGKIGCQEGVNLGRSLVNHDWGSNLSILDLGTHINFHIFESLLDGDTILDGDIRSC